MNKNAKIFIVGDKSIIGSALVDYCKEKGFKHILSESSCGLNLLNQNAVYLFFKRERPEYVFITYPKSSGGILANIKHPADFIYDNLQIQNNIIHYSYKFGVKKLLFLGSSCVYPKTCPQPIKEEYLLSGPLEETSEPYAIAKIVGVKMCQFYNQQYGTSYISVIPATIYGPGDNFNLEQSHVIPALIKKFHDAKKEKKDRVVVWGTGKPRREFIYIDDMVRACIFLINKYNDNEIINVGCGEDLSIKELAVLIRDIVGFKGEIIFDRFKPDGVFKKLLDNNKIKRLGWKPKISLIKGIEKTYRWYKSKIR